MLATGLVYFIAAGVPTAAALSPWTRPVRAGASQLPAAPITAPAPTALEDPTLREAHAAFREGEEAFARGDYVGAVAGFERAQGLAPHPATLYNLAISLARAGQPLAAWQRFDELSRQADTVEQREEASRERDSLGRLLGFVTLRGPGGLEVCIDEDLVRLGPMGEIRQVVQPGTHTIRTAAGVETVGVEAGGEIEVQVPHARPRARTRPWAILGLVGSSGALSVGIGVAATGDSNTARGLGAAGVVAGTLALAGAVATLVVTEQSHARAKPKAVICRDRNSGRQPGAGPDPQPDPQRPGEGPVSLPLGQGPAPADGQGQ